MECTTYQAHLNAALDHLTSTVPSCLNVSQQLHRQDLNRLVLKYKQSAFVAGLDPGLKGIATLAGGSDCHNNLAQACDRALYTGSFERLSKFLSKIAALVLVRVVCRASQIFKTVLEYQINRAE